MIGILHDEFRVRIKRGVVRTHGRLAREIWIVNCQSLAWKIGQRITEAGKLSLQRLGECRHVNSLRHWPTGLHVTKTPC